MEQGRPDNVVAVAEEERLFVLVLHDGDASHEEHHLPGRSVEQVVSTLVSAISVHPFKPELGICHSFGHVDLHSSVRPESVGSSRWI
jgi:hypothetical protein